MGLSFDIDMSEVTATGAKLHREISTSLARAVRVSAEYAERQAKSRAPRKSGRLAGGIRTTDVRQTVNTASASVVSTAAHTPFVVDDTKAHKIEARRVKTLHWVAGGNHHFRRAVWHPGTKAQRFMLQAALAMRPHFDSASDRAVDEAIAKAMK